ncbi:MAG: DUF2339 domain-containing protein [Patescibacteria group bacterium]
MEFFIFLAWIIIFIFVLNVHNRVQKLEQSIKSDAIQHIPESNYQSQQQVIPSIEKTFSPITSSVALPKKVEPAFSDKLIEWIKEDWLFKLGALFLLIGFGWLTTYAFLNNWIGPMGRIAFGIIIGVLFLLFGWWRIKKYINQGGIFLVLGSTIILLTIFAAREIYDFFTPLSALIVIFLSTAFVAFASVKYNNPPLALISLIFAGIAPLFINAPTVDYVGLFSYLFVVILGAIWIVILTKKRELTMVALLLVVCYSLSHLCSSISVDIEILLFFAYAFSALFFITNTIGILKLKGKEIVFDLITAAGNGLFLLAWIMVAAQNEWKSLIIIAWMIVFATGAFLIFKITQKREPFYVYAGIGIAMLAAATSAELKGATLTIAYIIECGIISLVTHLVLQDIKITERINLLLICPGILAIGSIASDAWNVSVINKDFFVLLVLTLTLLMLGLFYLHKVRKVENKEPRRLNTTMIIIGSVYGYALIWLSLHSGFQNSNIATMISLVIYTIIGLICYFYGLANTKRCIKLYGGIVIGFIVARLFLIDIQEMDLAGKIVTFFLIGLLLISTAFLGKKKQNLNLSNNI